MALVMVRPRSAHRAAIRLVLLAALFGGCSFLAPTSPPATVVEGAWKRGADAPVALTEVAVAAHDDRIWVAGGLTGEGAGSTDVLVYDPEADTWTEGPDLPGPVHHSALVSDGASLGWSAGTTGNGFDAPTAECGGSTRRRRTDGSPTMPLPEARGAGAAAWDGSRIVYAGGVRVDGVSGAVFAFAGWCVEPGCPAGEAPRAPRRRPRTWRGGTSVLGGRVGGLDANLATADDPGHDRGDIGELPTPRGGVAAFWWPTLGACLVGGESPGGTNAQVECIDEDGDIAVLPDLAHPRHGLGAAVVDGVAYVLLGGDQPGLFVSPTVESLELP